MQDPPLIKAIYAELRASVGNEFSAGDLLRVAHQIVLAYRAALVEPAELADPERGSGFHSLPVDTAMNDGGWKVLNFEAPRLPRSEDVGPEVALYVDQQLTKYLGHEWRRLEPPG